METFAKSQIDDLIEYTLTIKNMYDKLSDWEAAPEEFSEKKQKEIENIFLIMNKALEIEKRKVDAIDVNSKNIEAISDYLIKDYADIEAVDFLYENHLERARVLNRLERKLINQALRNHYPIDNKNIDYAISRAIESNYIYATDYASRISDKGNLFTYLKAAKIFVSPTYDISYFPTQQIQPIAQYSKFQIITQNATSEEIRNNAIKYIDEEYQAIIDILYDGFSDEAFDDPSVFHSAIHLLMTMNACLISTLDPSYIDKSFLKFQKMKSQDENYGLTNELIQGILVRSKKQILNFTKKDSH